MYMGVKQEEPISPLFYGVLFFAHLSKTSSLPAIVIPPISVIWHLASCVIINFFQQHIIWNQGLHIYNFTGMILRLSPLKVIQMVLVCCISFSWSLKKSFICQFKKKYLVWKNKTQNFDIRLMILSKSPLPKFAKFCLLCQIRPTPGIISFPFMYIVRIDKG
jgi:hypothetical protein